MFMQIQNYPKKKKDRSVFQTRPRLLIKIVSLFYFLGIMSQLSVAQMTDPDTGALACNDNIQISLNEMCGGVTPDMFLEGYTGGQIFINVTGEDGTTGSGSNSMGGMTGSGFYNADGTEFNWGDFVGQTIDYKIISDELGNSCWGTASIELNLWPDLSSPCEYVPANRLEYSDEIGPETGTNGFPASSFPLVITEDCQDIEININQVLKWNCGSHIQPDWCQSSVIVSVIDENDLIVQGIFAVPAAQPFAFAIPAGTLPTGAYTIEVEADAATDSDGNPISAADAEGTISVSIDFTACTGDCFTYCSEEDSQAYPDEFITPTEINEIINMGCYASIQGDLIVLTDRQGTACEGITVVEYYANIINHGEVNKKLILTQAFETHPFTFSDINIPLAQDVDCSVEDYSPEGLAALYGIEYAYPYIIDIHNAEDTLVWQCTNELLEHIEVPVDTIEEMVPFDVDMDGVDDTWVLLPVVIKDLVEVITCTDSVQVAIPKDPRVIPIKSKYCNIIAGYTDTEFAACGGGRKIFRSWDLLDWCSAEQYNDIPQVFEVRDLIAPEIEPMDDIVASVEPWTCAAKIKLPEIEASDNCGTNSTNWVVSEGRVEDGYIVDLWLGTGPIEIIAVVKDDCDNAVRDTFNVAVVDLVKPVPVCADEVRVTLTSGGTAKVFAESFDAGSHDSGCGDVEIYVRRKDGCCDDQCETMEECTARDPKTGICIESEVVPVGDAFGKYVKFCCTDAGKSIPVELLVVDHIGNQNVCWVLVTIEDKGDVQCFVEDARIGCLDDINDLTLTGSPNLSSSCEEVDMIYEDLGIIDGCGEGVMQRCWYFDLDGSGDVSDGDTNGCCQTIYIENNGSFDPHTIKWPKHYDDKVVSGINLECADIDGDGDLDVGVYDPVDVQMGSSFTCVPDDVGGRPYWCEINCGLVGFSAEIDTVTASDACLKIIKRWTVIDWCTWEANGGGIDDENDTDNDVFEAVTDWAQGVCAECGVGRNGPAIEDSVYFRYQYGQVDLDGYYTFDQVIKVVDDQDPTIDAPAEFTVNTIGGNLSKEDDIPCTGSDTVTASAEDFCGGESSGSELLKWVITRIENGVEVADKTSTGPTATMGSGDGEPGDTHIIRWTVIDGCGNQASSETEISFGDNTAPTPFCISGLTTTVMPLGGTVAVWAKDFDFGSFDNCTSPEDLVFGLVRDGETPIMPGEEGFGTQTGITYTCAELGNSNVDILNMWVWDINGNGDFCTVQILIEDNANVCENTDGEGSKATIAGTISTELGEMVGEVAVSLETNLPEYPVVMATGEEGIYAFMNTPMGLNYEVKAKKNIDHINGVSTLDLVLMQKHILGLKLLDSPYKVIAADVNNDERVSASDLVSLRKLILGIYDELPNNESWRFVDATQTFSDILNPFPFTEDLSVENLTQNRMNEDYIGVKIGDISGNARANNLQNITTRTSGTLKLSIDDQYIAKGEVYQMDITAENFEHVYGVQFTMNHNGLTLIDIKSGILEVNEQNIGIRENELSFSWSEIESVSSNEVLFSLVFTADKNIDLRNVLDINSNITSAEAYVGPEMEQKKIALSIRTNGLKVEGFTLSQNEPNPFESVTNIGFAIPESGTVTLRIYDVAGKVLLQKSNQFDSGKQQFTVRKSEIGVTGLLYYEIQQGALTASKKMIVLD